jgi:hypothetical protein
MFTREAELLIPLARNLGISWDISPSIYLEHCVYRGRSCSSSRSEERLLAALLAIGGASV